MKQVSLLLVSGLVAVSSFGQYAKQATSTVYNTTRKVRNVSEPAPANVAGPAGHSGARTTTTAFYTEDFGSGTHTSLPTGWTTGAITVGTWKWTNLGSSSSFTMGAMASTTAANGWMIFDSDSIGAATSGAPAGWLQSPAYNCSTHPYVRLNFQDFYRKFQDSCFVWVSTTPTFTTHTTHPVITNNQLATNIFTPNPTDVHINISAAAGGQPAVYIRFVTYGPDLGAYSWMIDDMTISDLDSVDIGLEKSSSVYYGGSSTGFFSFGTMPSKMMDTVYPESFVINYGYTAQPAVTVTAKILQGLTNVYTSNINVNAPVNAYDSLADFIPATPSGYYSNTIATYTMPFSVNPTGDAVTANNRDTTTFAVTDSTWSENRPGAQTVSSAYVYRPGSTANRMSYSPATQFIVPAGQIDTLTSVSVAFSRATKPGQKVGVQIFHYDGSVWALDGVTTFRALTAGDISTSGSTTFATFMVDEVATSGKIIFNGGTNGVSYAAVVKGDANTDSVLVLETEDPAPSELMSGNHSGLADTSLNNGSTSYEFGQGGLPFYTETTPMINLNFGNVVTTVDHSAVKDVTAGNFVGKPYPNPANTSVSIPFTMNQDALVTVTLSNVMGQVVSTQNVNAAGGKGSKATFATSGLANGVYMYSVVANGETVNGRVVVAH